MEKKIQPRPATLSFKGGSESKSTDYSNKKYGSQYPRKRDGDKFDNKKWQAYRGGRSSQRYVRPREKVGSQIEAQYNDSEIGSLQRSGGKKQNITHLMHNWWGPGPNSSKRGNYKSSYNGSLGKKHGATHAKYNKEHYLQANCQFVVKSGNDYSHYERDVDHLVEWEWIEEVRLHMTEPPACPICLHPPIAAKVTRCGHIYCYSCILHYLSLSDHESRNCPICYKNKVTIDDLRSVKAILHKNWKCGEEIELKLMRRERDSLIPAQVSDLPAREQTSSSWDSNSYSKLIVASPEEVSKQIVLRELEDLKLQLAIEGDQPEACFIKEALTLTESRQASLASSIDSATSCQGAESLKDVSEPLEDIVATELVQLGFEESGVPNENCCNDASLGLNAEGVEQDTSSDILDMCQYQTEDYQHSYQDGRSGGPKTVFYFYQETGGAHVYLHPMNVHMLTNEYGSLENSPLTIRAKVLEKESKSVTESMRQRYRYLSHLPITCMLELVEVELKEPIISKCILNGFKGQIDERAKVRRMRAKKEHQLQKRAQVNEDRMMGRSRGSSINMTSFKHFPTFTEVTEDPPLGTSEDESVASTLGTSCSSATSLPDEFPSINPPSFAQMIREGNKKPSLPISKSLQTRHASSNIDIPKQRQGETGHGSEDEEGERVPDYSTAFSDDFAKVLAASKQALDEKDSGCQRGKKGKKKKKGIVLLSYGGR